MDKKDYLHIIAGLIGDSAGSVPIVGGFITGVKNVAYNIAEKKQKERIERFLHELENKVLNIEAKFERLKDNEQFVIHFFKTLYYIRDTFDNNQYNAFLNYICEYLEDEFEKDEMSFMFDLLTSLDPFSWKLLKKIFEDKSTNWFSTKQYFLGTGEKENDLIDYKDLDYKTHKTLSDFVKSGILQEKHTMHLGDNSSGYIGKIKISKLGERLISLLQDKT